MGSSNQAWWDARTPEQRANHRRKTKAGMHAWHARRSEAERLASNLKRTDAAVIQMWVPKGPRTSRKGGRKRVDPNTPVGNTTLAKIEKASIKRIIRDLAGRRPELFENAIIDGLLAEPPRSFPYVALCISYTDGKAVDSSNDIHTQPQLHANLADLTREQLMQRALRIAQILKTATDEQTVLVQEREARGAGLTIIDITPEPEREPTLEELQAEVVRVNEEVRLAQEDVARTQAVLRILKMGGK
jgi:hypothetical protein